MTMEFIQKLRASSAVSENEKLKHDNLMLRSEGFALREVIKSLNIQNDALREENAQLLQQLEDMKRNDKEYWYVREYKIKKD